MGGDHGPSVVVPGVAQAAAHLEGRPVRFLLHGDEARIAPELARHPKAAAVSEVRHTDLVIAMDEKPATAMRRGKGSSMWNAIETVKTGEARAAVSAGNTGALMAVSKLLLRMSAPGLDRPAIVASWPTMKGVTAVLDVGANVQSDARQLVEFAIMGEAFHRAVHGVARPSIGLMNVGAEDMKGHEEVREAQNMLREGGFDLNYYGFVEGDDIAKGTVDVIVTDGFTGNIALKTAEGTARFISALMKEALTSSLMSKVGALIASPALKAMRRRIDPNSINGGPLLGLNGTVVKSHGGADARGIGNAIKLAASLAASDYAAEIARNMQRLTAVADEAHAVPAETQA
jgi:glycerol-3-phosphate acyltransferase PlsX